jgi:hypothetical protein
MNSQSQDLKNVVQFIYIFCILPVVYSKQVNSDCSIISFVVFNILLAL